MEEAVIKSGIHWNSSRVSRKVLFVDLGAKMMTERFVGWWGWPDICPSHITISMEFYSQHLYLCLCTDQQQSPWVRGMGAPFGRLLRNVLSVPDHHAASSETRTLVCSSAQNVLQPWVLFCYLCQFPFSSRFFHYSQWVSLGLYN